jgi:hypothetical protein
VQDFVPVLVQRQARLSLIETENATRTDTDKADTEHRLVT